jgi:CubicO group peptidase (beta-lactamase class C family)
MKRMRFLGLYLILATAAAGQPSPAEQRLRSLVELTASCEVDKVLAWVKASFTEGHFKSASSGAIADRICAMSRQAGGFDIESVEPRGEGEVEAVLKSKAKPAKVTMRLGTEAASPHLIRGWGYRPGDPNQFRNIIQEAVHGAGDREKAEAIAKAARTLAAQQKFSGTILIARGGEVLYQEAFGKSNNASGVANTLDTKFHLGSMPKMFTSVAVAQLVQAGKLKYDEPISAYLPDYPNQEVARKVTLHHLLTHTSGLGDYFGPDFGKKSGELKKLEDYYQFFASKPLRFEPGTSWSYSNAGMHVAGIIVERISGMSYYDYVERHVFGRAGMARTGNDFRSLPEPGLATGHTRMGTDDVLELDPPTRANTSTLPPRGGPAGGAHSTLADLYRFSQALIANRLIGDTYTRLVTTGKVESRGGSGAKYAYGFEEFSIHGKRVIGHSGGAPGMNAILRIAPGSGHVVVVLSNWDPPVAQELGEQAMALMMRD